MNHRIGLILGLAVAGVISFAMPATAQDNYEIQVYGADTDRKSVV